MASEEQKRLLQHLLYKPMVTSQEFINLHQTIFNKTATSKDLHDLVKILNELLKPAQLAIKHRLCEDTNNEIFVLLSTTETEAAKHTSEFSLPELDLFKAIIKEVLNSNNGTVSSIDCINLSTSINKLSKSDAQKALDKFFSSQWLKEKEGEVSFTARTLLELEPLLKKLDTDLGECQICGLLAVKVVVCPNEECAIKVHRFCLSKLSRTSVNSTLKCPTCHNPWTVAAVSSQEDSSSSRSQSPAPREASQGRSNGTSRRRTAKQIASSSEDSN